MNHIYLQSPGALLWVISVIRSHLHLTNQLWDSSEEKQNPLTKSHIKL